MEALEKRIAEATRDLEVQDILELGTGDGRLAERLLRLFPAARLTGVERDVELLAAARARLGPAPLLIVAALDDPLPRGPYDLVVSAVAGPELAPRAAAVLRAGGRAILAGPSSEPGVFAGSRR